MLQLKEKFMKKSANLLVLLSMIMIIFIVFSSCKKGNPEDEKYAKILKENKNLAKRAIINQEISKLSEQIIAAKDDTERARLFVKKANKEADKGDIASSIESSRDSIKCNPSRTNAHFMLGRAYLRDGKYDDAKQELFTALKYNKECAPCHFELGNLYYKELEYPDAVKEYILAVKYDTTHYMAYNNLGVVYYLIGKGGKSMKALEKAKKIEPEYPGIYKNLGIVNELKFKRKKAALVYYRKYLKLCPNAPERKAVKMWISAIGG